MDFGCEVMGVCQQMAPESSPENEQQLESPVLSSLRRLDTLKVRVLGLDAESGRVRLCQHHQRRPAPPVSTMKSPC